MKKRETPFYELSNKEFNTIVQSIYKIRVYHDSDGSLTPDLLEEALTTIELIFDDVEKD